LGYWVFNLLHIIAQPKNKTILHSDSSSSSTPAQLMHATPIIYTSTGVLAASSSTAMYHQPFVAAY
jgi:hypothetical protein